MSKTEYTLTVEKIATARLTVQATNEEEARKLVEEKARTIITENNQKVWSNKSITVK
jgi:hypothetical protein